MNIKGLDVSEFQGEINWERVKNAGYQFAMIRAGYGFNTIDKQFQRNASECNRIGLPIGVYWFCYAVSPETAIQEADGCLRTIRNYRIDYPVCYDIEQASAAYALGEGVTITPALAKRYAFWYARYASSFDGTDCGMWQYTNEGSVPGIGGNVDLDIGYIDYPGIIRRAGLNHLSETAPPPAPPSAPTYITYTIQPGDTLSEIAERFGTTVSSLSALNGISDPNLIYAGNTLRIPQGGNSASVYYTIQPGDTLSEIAERFGTTVASLSALNGISDPNLIYAGNTLLISQ